MEVSLGASESGCPPSGEKTAERKIYTDLSFLQEAVHRLRDVGCVYTVVVRICTVVALLDQS
jgi:hypothetical protein